MPPKGQLSNRGDLVRRRPFQRSLGARTRRRVRLLVLGAVAVIGASLMAQPANAGELKRVEDAMVTGPVPSGYGVKGYPFSASLIGLARFGYVEEEYFIEGRATAGNGASAPYKTRLVVRRPKDPARFNGSVVLDWFNVTGGFDVDSEWIYTYEELLRSGYAYVGVSVQMVGVQGSPRALKLWDPVRYAALSHPGDDVAIQLV